MKDFLPTKIKLFANTDEGKWTPSVHRDWMVIVTVTFVSIFVFVSLHFYLYIMMMSSNFYSNTDFSSVSSIDRIQKQDLLRVIKKFEQKKKNFDTIIGQKSSAFSEKNTNVPVVATSTVHTPVSNIPVRIQ